MGQGKRTCANCRKAIPDKMACQPRINSSLVFAIRMARTSKATTVVTPRIFQFVHNEDLPDQAFTTERAKKAGKSNAKSGRIFVTIPHDHLGPITAEYDPIRNMGVLVGDCWEDRLACRQWGAHFPHVSGIAGQSTFGAQSVVLSGGYDDDEDHGEWFLYTGRYVFDDFKISLCQLQLQSAFCDYMVILMSLTSDYLGILLAHLYFSYL